MTLTRLKSFTNNSSFLPDDADGWQDDYEPLALLPRRVLSASCFGKNTITAGPYVIGQAGGEASTTVAASAFYLSPTDFAVTPGFTLRYIAEVIVRRNATDWGAALDFGLSLAGQLDGLGWSLGNYVYTGASPVFPVSFSASELLAGDFTRKTVEWTPNSSDLVVPTVTAGAGAINANARAIFDFNLYAKQVPA